MCFDKPVAPVHRAGGGGDWGGKTIIALCWWALRVPPSAPGTFGGCAMICFVFWFVICLFCSFFICFVFVLCFWFSY